MKLEFVTRLNGTESSGIADVSQIPPIIICLCGEENAKNIISAFIKSEKWDKLDKEISHYYLEEYDEGYDEDEEMDYNLCDIGETAAQAFGYL